MGAGQDTVLSMIDKGFRLGLHGHQHKSHASPESIYSSEKQTMAVLSAGSLCAGSAELPTGFSRQYNIIEIDDDYSRARVHVREMQMPPGIFSAGRLMALGGKSYTEVEWSPVSNLRPVNTGRSGGRKVATIEEIERLLALGENEKAIQEISGANGLLGNYGRKLLTKAFSQAEDWKNLQSHLTSPQNSEELMQVLMACFALKDWLSGERILRDAELSGSFPALLIKELKNRLAVEKGISE